MPPTSTRPGDGRILATPLARAVAGDLGVDLASVAGSGRGGRILRADVEALAAAAPAAAAPDADQVPQVHLTIRVDAEALLGFRAELDRQLGDLEVSVTALIVKACAGVLRASPELNVSFAWDRLLRHRRVHVGIAVAGEGGLVVPVVRDADRKRLAQVAREAADLTARARAGRLAPDEVGGATFTVSDLGTLGERFMALLNPPEAAVLAVGAALPEPVATADGEVEVHRVLRLTLSIDHRALDGATGAGFLARLRTALEHPLQIVA
jgi:pyruvate dehydrogenase E2 component (dihydrolipoamide acetyltransferase)